MQFDEDKTIEEILALIPSEEKKEEPETEALPDFIKEEKEKKRRKSR